LDETNGMKLPEELQYIRNSLLPQKSTDARMDGKICVITGANAGIGFEAASKCAQAGAEIVMVCRNPEKAQQARQKLIDAHQARVRVFLADFTRLEQVFQAASAIREAYPKFDVLINNAGVFNKRRRLTPDGYEETFCVVHLASFLLTRLLLGSLEQGAPSRVLYISSEAHRFGGLKLEDLDWRKRPYIGLLAYGAAKIAQIHTALVMAEQYRVRGVTFNLMHPGTVRTNIGMNNGWLYRLYSRYILRWFMKAPSVSGEAIYYLAADPGLEDVTGTFFNQTIAEQPARYAVKPQHRQAVWDQSLSLIQPYLEGEL
jgi:NAD(P)-dependent dehydrogenase (short-subunit alcohol dehydrogenase family)